MSCATRELMIVVQQAFNVNKEAAGLTIEVWILSSPLAKLTLRLGVPNLLQSGNATSIHCFVGPDVRHHRLCIAIIY